MTQATITLTLAQRIQIAREGVEMSKSQLARELNTSHTTVNNWESGAHEIKLADAVKLARITGVSLEWLADGVSSDICG